MKTLKFIAITLMASAIAWSCQTGPSETDKAYEKVVSQTDSIQTMNSYLKDTLQMIMSANQNLMSSMDTATQESSNLDLATLSRNQVIFEEQQASLNKIDEMISNFESFEGEYDKGDMNKEDVKAKIDEIKGQQKDILNRQKKVRNELNRIHDDHQNMQDRQANTMTDGERMDHQTTTGRN